jgi:ribosome-associated translation inhibitor RaiA
MTQNVSIARHLDLTLQLLLRELCGELGDICSEVEVQCSMVPIVLTRFRNRIVSAANRFGQVVADQYHRKIQPEIERVTSATAQLSSSRVILQGAMSSLLGHLAKGEQEGVTENVNIEQVIRSVIDQARRNAVFLENENLAVAQDSDVSDQILTAINANVARLDKLYAPILQRAQKRRVRLETELDSLLGKIKRLETQRIQRSVAVLEDAEEHDDFDRVTLAIDGSLLELSRQIRSHKDRPSPANV